MEASWHRILHREEQRATARHVAVVNTAWIAWEDPSGRVHTENAILLDVSRGGANLQVERFAPCLTLWLCIEGSGKVWGSRFETIEEHANSLTGNRLRGRFADACPEEFYRVALRGHRGEKSAAPDPPRAKSSLFDWLRGRIGRRPRPTDKDESVIDLAVVRQQVVRRLAEGAVEVVLSETIDEPSTERRRSAVSV